MEEMEGVELYGAWPSPYCLEAQIAFKLKGIPYTYKEENLEDKSESLLKYNPVYKKVPVLVHDGKPLAESLVILEYIDETWENKPRLLPTDPYDRARARFWLTFLDKNFVPACWTILVTEGIEQEKAIRETKEQLRIFEEGVGKEFSAEKTQLFHGNEPGILDIVLGSAYGWIRVLGELTGVELVDKDDSDLMPTNQSIRIASGHERRTATT